MTTSVLDGEAVDVFNAARADYLAAQPITFDVAFDDVSFGYWGRQGDLERAAIGILGFDDAKSERFTRIGEARWRDILTFSPAEPGLARAQELPDGRLSAGGWTDPVPTQVLEALGCDVVVLVNRRDGIGGFTTGVAELLGASQDELDDLYDLSDPASAFSLSLSRADGVWCTDWDAPDTFDIDALSAEGYNAPLETASDFFLGAAEPYPGAATGLGIFGCSASVSP